MLRVFPILILFAFLQQSYAQVGRDKVLHFLGGNLYGLAGAGIAKQISDGDRWWTFAGSVAGATLIGLGKEAVDAGQRENGWDNEDLAATILGGVAVGITIDLFTDHKKNNKKQQENRDVGENQQQYGQYARLDKLLERQQAPSLSSLSLPSGLLE